MCQQRFHQKLNFSRTSNRIQYCSSNGYSLKRELQQGMNKLNIGSNWGISYLNKRETQYEPWNFYSWDKIKKMRNYKGNPDITINRFIFQGRTHLTDRLKAERYENCDKTTQLQIHHIG
ncbi:MAG: hypothetical protein Q8871_02505, partial [Pigeon pea little leaf phytoplasma]|nr:hypothetical protein [Pigeon pea little leaf phytoplasma]